MFCDDASGRACACHHLDDVGSMHDELEPFGFLIDQLELENS